MLEQASNTAITLSMAKYVAIRNRIAQVHKCLQHLLAVPKFAQC